jgi:hypothetical protein
VKREEEAKMRFTMRGFFFFYSFYYLRGREKGLGLGGVFPGFQTTLAHKVHSNKVGESMI